MEDVERYKEDFIAKRPFYENLGSSLCVALELIFQENQIDYLSVYHRVKETDSFEEKIQRKKYDDPFKQMEDLCGIRIICYYPKDVELISSLLKKELEVKQSQDKEDLLELNQFGYRSHHLIVSVPEAWLTTPNFRNLRGIKAEIQIRTVLMHAWAEIEHKLSYKKKSHIPSQFKRKLYRISAKLEEADEQFQELKEQSQDFQREIIKKAKSREFDFSSITSIDLDTLQAYLKFRFNERPPNAVDVPGLLDELQQHGITIGDIENAYQKAKPYIKELEQEVFSKSGKQWTRTGIVRAILDLTLEKYFESRTMPARVRELKKEWRKKYNL